VSFRRDDACVAGRAPCRLAAERCCAIAGGLHTSLIRRRSGEDLRIRRHRWDQRSHAGGIEQVNALHPLCVTRGHELKSITIRPMKRHVLFAGLLLVTGTLFSASLHAQQPSGGTDGLTTTNCVEQLRKSTSEWIECDGAFQPDATGRADLSKMTLNFVVDAKCAGK